MRTLGAWYRACCGQREAKDSKAAPHAVLAYKTIGGGWAPGMDSLSLHNSGSSFLSSDQTMMPTNNKTTFMIV